VRLCLVAGGAREVLADLRSRHAVCGEEVHEFGLWGLEAKGAQRHAQLVVVEVAVAIEVEEVELYTGIVISKAVLE
jgi:hypothetical protein